MGLVNVEAVRRALSSVEAAALAGLGAAVLLTLSVYLLGRQPGVGGSAEDLEWYGDSGNRFTVFLGLNLAPFGVVAFLWFMAVIRRRLGEREDQFFATVFFGSGIAFGLLAITAAVCAAAPTFVVQFSGEPRWVHRRARARPVVRPVGRERVAAGRRVHVGDLDHRDALRRAPEVARAARIRARRAPRPDGAFAGPLDFLFTAWLAVVSLTLLFTRRRRDRASSHVARPSASDP